MTVRWIAGRVAREIIRDRRTIAFFLVVPVVIMTLIYYAISEDEVARVAVVTRGVARLFDADLMAALESEEDIEVVELAIPDDEVDEDRLRELITQALRQRHADGVLYMEGTLLEERFAGQPGTLHLYLEGSRPTLTASVASGIASAMDNLADALPTVIDASCSDLCADSVNTSPMELERHFLYGSDDLRTLDFFLPVLPPFFVFFLTFIISVITFQRERVRGTLERLLIAPVSFGQVVLGYIGGFVIFASMQAAIVLAYFLMLIGFPVSATQVISLAILMLILLLIALVMGLLASFVANNEFQAIQMVPLIILPQVFLSDLIWTLESFPPLLRWIAYALPLTHANIAARDVMLKNMPLWQTWPQLLALAGFFLGVWALLNIVGRSPRRGL